MKQRQSCAGRCAMDGGWAIARTTTAALTMRLYDQLRRSEDAREGRRAFAEKRQPQWQER